MSSDAMKEELLQSVRPSVIPPGSVVDNGSGSGDDDDASPALPCPAQTGTNPCHRRRE